VFSEKDGGFGGGVEGAGEIKVLKVPPARADFPILWSKKD
jgi:hypothetical protein